ncbi:MAG: tRNA dihydrouridine synthase DusB [Clostridium sp. 26_22]|nr:MAG: tRNA dihydrouridine synthase DusB [Clostridium sp. 26_22]
MYLKKLKIKDLELENNLILAPMAGVTDLPFRKICKEFGPGLVCTEMVSSKAIYHDDTKTKLLMNTDGEKRPISMQIFGSDEETMSYASKYVSKIADIVDINMGCPAPKVVKNGDGSKLLLDIEKAEKVIKAVVKNSTKPVTLKIRKGWDCNNIVAIEFAQMAEKAGVSAITIHGRTRTEMYSGKVDLDIIKKVKESVKIPVIGNGDIVDEESALKMFEYTGVDGIMIGRGTFGNPWIFERIKYYLETGEKLPLVTNEEKLRVIKKQIQLELDNKPEVTAIREMRKHIAWYTKNMPNSSEFRCEINKIEDKEQLMEIVEDYFLKVNRV